MRMQSSTSRRLFLQQSQHQHGFASKPSGGRVLAHTHPHDELVTVIEGTWYVGKGERFDAAKLNGYGPGSFVIILARYRLS
jgi:quercetin dioxygenase-like cupin family protein